MDTKDALSQQNINRDTEIARTIRDEQLNHPESLRKYVTEEGRTKSACINPMHPLEENCFKLKIAHSDFKKALEQEGKKREIVLTQESTGRDSFVNESQRDNQKHLVFVL